MTLAASEHVHCDSIACVMEVNSHIAFCEGRHAQASIYLLRGVATTDLSRAGSVFAFLQLSLLIRMETNTTFNVVVKIGMRGTTTSLTGRVLFIWLFCGT